MPRREYQSLGDQGMSGKLSLRLDTLIPSWIFNQVMMIISSGPWMRSIITAGAAISRTFLTPFINPRGFRSLIPSRVVGTELLYAGLWYYLGKTSFFIRALIANLWCANFNLLPAKYPKFNNNQMELGFGTEFQSAAEYVCMTCSQLNSHMRS